MKASKPFHSILKEAKGYQVRRENRAFLHDLAARLPFVWHGRFPRSGILADLPGIS